MSLPEPGPASARDQCYRASLGKGGPSRESTVLFRVVHFGDTLGKMNPKCIVLNDPLFLETENWRGTPCLSF